ncbi:MAG: efflux RND transporter periplasmic adaptor subunit [Chthoniobacteraceae bacterium]
MRSNPCLLIAALTASLALAGATLAEDPAILGYTEPSRIITVSAGDVGVIAEMLVKEGDRVKNGQVLARLDTSVLDAELEIARAEAKLAGTRNQRVLDLAQSTRVTPEELEKARTELTIKQAQVRRIDAMIEVRTMRSPVDGVVTEIKRDPSESVSAASPHVLTVVQIDRLSVNLFLPPARVEKLKNGDQAELLLLDPERRVPATVEFVSPIIDAASGTVRVKFSIANPKGEIRSGGRCTLEADETRSLARGVALEPARESSLR